MAANTLNHLSPFPEARGVVFNTPNVVYTIKFAGATAYTLNPPANGVFTVSCDQNIWVNASNTAAAIPPQQASGSNTAVGQSELNPGGARACYASVNLSFYTAVSANASVSFWEGSLGA